MSRAGTLIAWLLLLAQTLCAQPAQRGYDPAFIMGASDGERLWIITRSLDERDAPCTVFQAPPDLDPGSLRRVTGLAEAPEAVAAIEDSLVCVFAPSGEGSGVRRVRAYRLRTTPGGTMYSEPARILPPLPGDGVLIGTAFAGGDLHALLVREGVPELLRRSGEGWTSVDLPPGWPEGASLALTQGAAAPTVLVHADDVATQWSRTEDGWTERPVDLAPDERLLMASDGEQLRVLFENEGVRIEAVAQAESGTSARASAIEIAGVPEQAVVLPAGEAIAVAWPEGDGTMRVALRVVGRDGSELYAGHAEMRGPVSPTDIQALALAMLAICTLVVVFVVRTGEEREPHLPDGYALASPLRRAIAWLIDLAPGVIGVALIWPDLADLPGTVFGASGPGGPWPLALIVGQLIVLSTVGEATTGRTLGKLLMGLRTMTYDGDHPTWWMAFSRNVVRAMLPPLAVFSALNPTMAHPQSFQTLVVVKRPGV
ncbi:MAG: hypothetical protein Tsb0013_00830 [Phycisphaerales bacterium]